MDLHHLRGVLFFYIAGPLKYVGLFTIHKILFIYIYIYNVVHLLVWIIKTALLAIPVYTTASSLPFSHLHV